MKNKKRNCWLLSCAAVLVMGAALADTVEETLASDGFVAEVAGVPGDNTFVFEELSDELRTKTATLETLSAAHYYSFKSVRGQKVLLAVSVLDKTPVFWEVEYFEGGEWKKFLGLSKVFPEAAAGSEVKIRVTHKKDVPFASKPYTVILGSLPVLKSYDLEDQYGINRIPTGYTTPSFFMTQAYTTAYLKAYFTDTKGSPLKGALGRFELNLAESGIATVPQHVVSDKDGRVSKVIEFGHCSGGRESDEIRYFYGEGVWRSYYYRGEYTLLNEFFDSTVVGALPFDKRVMGHVCKHRKVRR